MAKQSWLDEDGQTTVIDDHAKRLTSFLNAMADGRIEKHELDSQEKRLVELMKVIEPKLDDKMHAQVTELLSEISAFSIMQVLFEIDQLRPKTKFRG